MENLSDAQWARIEHLFVEPARKALGRPLANPRAILDAIRWTRETGEPWKRLPATYPPQQTCYTKMLAWKKHGLLEEALQILETVVAVEGDLESDEA